MSNKERFNGGNGTNSPVREGGCSQLLLAMSEHAGVPYEQLASGLMNMVRREREIMPDGTRILNFSSRSAAELYSERRR